MYTSPSINIYCAPPQPIKSCPVRAYLPTKHLMFPIGTSAMSVLCYICNIIYPTYQDVGFKLYLKHRHSDVIL